VEDALRKLRMEFCCGVKTQRDRSAPRGAEGFGLARRSFSGRSEQRWRGSWIFCKRRLSTTASVLLPLGTRPRPFEPAHFDPPCGFWTAATKLSERIEAGKRHIADWPGNQKLRMRRNLGEQVQEEATQEFIQAKRLKASGRAMASQPGKVTFPLSSKRDQTVVGDATRWA